MSLTMSVGCQTSVVTSTSFARTVKGGRWELTSATASAQRTSMRNGNPPSVCDAQE